MAPALPTVIYRMHAARFSATDTTGSLLAPGRWHSQGTRILYAAQHISLALLETLVHAGGTPMPPRSLTRMIVPATVKIETAKWLDRPASQAFGDAWVRSGRTAVLRVPSIVVHQMEDNFVLNPAHPEFAKIRFEKPQSFPLDPRLVPFS